MEVPGAEEMVVSVSASEMTIEERRHEGAKKLVTGCEQIIQKAGEIFWQNCVSVSVFDIFSSSESES